MARNRLVPWPFQWLIVLVLSFQPTLALSAAAVNGDVPDYVMRHAPLVWLHSNDPFRPSDLLEHIRHTTPTVGQEPVPGLPELDLDNLALLNDVIAGTDQVALTSRDNVTAIPAWFLGESPDASGAISNSTPCVVITVEQNSGQVDAFYFYFYSYNRGPNITQVLEPLDRLIQDIDHSMHFSDHVGDWEHNMVRFRDGKPTGIYYSQHNSGAAYQWDDTALSKKDDRPLVYSAYGSHANYESPGGHIHDMAMLDYCDEGQLWDPVLSAYFYKFDPTSSTLMRIFSSDATSSSDSNLTSFLYFTGIWGDAQYPDSDPIQETVPYFGIKRFVSGPQGPLAKQLLRDGLLPDAERKTWIQWGVGIFMSWYPCCIRGWRIWISEMVVLVSIALVIFAIRYSIKRYRTKGYQRVGTDIPLEDLGSREHIE